MKISLSFPILFPKKLFQASSPSPLFCTLSKISMFSQDLKGQKYVKFVKIESENFITNDRKENFF